jgi:hypothetical protein
MASMVMDIIVEMTAGAVVIVAATVVAAVVVVETAGLVAAVEIAGPAVVAADADRSNGYADTTKIIRNKYQKIILRCYNQKDPSIGKGRKDASVRLQKEGTLLLSVRMH